MSISVCIAIITGLISAALWLASACVNVSHGYDMDIELNMAYKRISKINALAAFFSAISIIFSNVDNIIKCTSILNCH